MKKNFIGNLLLLAALATLVFIVMLVNCGANMVTLVAAGCAFASPLLCAAGHVKNGDAATVVGFLASCVGGWWCVGTFVLVRLISAKVVKCDELLKVEE